MAVSLEGTVVASWVFAAVGIVLTAARYALRHFVIRRWYWDDLTHGIVLVLYIAQAAELTATLPILEGVSNKNNHLPLNEKYRAYLQVNTSYTLLSFSIYWITKITFLLFYRLLFKTNRWLMRFWWALLAYTVATYWVVVAGALVKCGGAAEHLLEEDVCQGAFAKAIGPKNFIVSYCMNVSTDLFIMLLPLMCLKSLQLSFRRKLGIGALFCVGFIIIIFESVRLAESEKSTVGANNTFWGVLEGGFCIIVSCLPVFSAVKIWKRNGYRSSASAYGQRLRAQPIHRNPPINAPCDEDAGIKKPVELSHTTKISAHSHV